MTLSGNYHVRVLRSAFLDARAILPRSRHRAQLRRHALKLRYFGSPGAEEARELDWSWIRSLQGSKIGELRIHERIGDCDNLRIIFFNPEVPERPLPILWILAVFQKKRNDFTSGQIANFAGRRQLVLDRFYGGGSRAASSKDPYFDRDIEL